MQGSLRDQAARGIKWSAVSTSVTIAFQMIQVAVLARLLAPGDFGLMAMLLVVIGFAQCFSDMGLSNVIIHRQDISRPSLSSLYWAGAAAGLAVSVVMFTSAGLLALFFSEPRVAPLARFTSAAFLIIPLGQPFQFMLQKALRFRALALAEFFGGVFGLGVSVASALSGQGVFSLIYGFLALSGVRTLALIAAGWKEWRPQAAFSLRSLKGLVAFGQFQMGERTLNYLKGNIDKLLTARWLGAEALGYYSVAFQLMSRPVLLLNSIISRVAFPILSRVQDNPARLKHGYLEILQMVGFYCFPLYGGMYAAAGPLVRVFLGEGWEAVVPVLRIIVIPGVFIGLGNPIGSLILAKGRADLSFYLNIMAFVLTVSALIAGSRFGMPGICWSLAAVYGVVLFPLNFWVCRKLADIRVGEYMGSLYPSLGFSAVMTGALIPVSRRLAPLGPVLQLVCLLTAGALIYFLLYLTFNRDFLKKGLALIRA